MNQGYANAPKRTQPLLIVMLKSHRIQRYTAQRQEMANFGPTRALRPIPHQHVRGRYVTFPVQLA